MSGDTNYERTRAFEAPSYTAARASKERDALLSTRADELGKLASTAGTRTDSVHLRRIRLDEAARKRDGRPSNYDPSLVMVGLGPLAGKANVGHLTLVDNTGSNTLIFWTVRFEAGQDTIAKVIQLLEGVFAVVTILLVRVMFIGQKLKQVQQNVRITPSDVFVSGLELPPRCLDGAIQVTLVGRALFDTVGRHADELEELLRGSDSAATVTVVIANPNSEALLLRLEQIYHGKFTAEEHGRRLKVVIDNVGVVARRAECGDRLQLRLLEEVVAIGGYVVRKPRRQRIVGVEIYLPGDVSHPAVWFSERDDPELFEASASLLEELAQSGELVDLAGVE